MPVAANIIGSVLPKLRGFVAPKLRMPSMRGAAAIALVSGAGWLGLEYALRGAEGGVSIDARLVGILIVVLALSGLSARARVSAAGEVAINLELVLTVVLVTFLLPALMLVVYAIATLVSGGTIGAAWLLWSVCCVAAIVIQIAIYAGFVGALILAKEINWGAVVVAGIYIALIGRIAHSMTGRWAAGFDFTIFHWTASRREIIPEWMYAVNALRRLYARVDHVRLLSIQTSIIVGALAGLMSSLAIRRIRQRLMTNVVLRPFLPMASAPVPDTVPLIDRRMFVPIVVYSHIGWGAMLLVKLA